jgi:Tfp pilus assembly protein PilN
MKKTVTTIRITDTDIRVSQSGEARGKGVITFCDARSIAGCSDTAVAKLLSDMLSSLPARPSDVVFLVPRRSVIVKQMRLPSHKRDEINDMIGMLLVNNLPFPVEDVVYEYGLLSRDADGYSRVLAGIIHKDISLRYCRLMQKAGIKDGKLVFDSLGISMWLAYQERSHKAGDRRPVVVLNVDAQNSEICFCGNKNLFFSRSIPYGEDHLFSGDTAELQRQVSLSLEAYREERLGPQISGMIILSTAAPAKEFARRLEAASGIPAAVTDPFTDIFCARKMDQGVLRECLPSSTTAELGFLFSGAGNAINLAPEEIHREKQVKAHRRQLAVFFLLVFIASALSVSAQLIDIHKKQARLAMVKREIGRLQPQLKEGARKAQFVKFFDSKLSHNNFIPDLIDELNRVAPEDISLRILSLDREKRLMIQGYAQAQSGINDFRERLIRSRYFSNVELKHATKRKIANTPVMDFKIVSQLSNERGGAL